MVLGSLWDLTTEARLEGQKIMEHFFTKKPLSKRVNTIDEKSYIISFADKSLFCKIMKSLDEQIEKG